MIKLILSLFLVSPICLAQKSYKMDDKDDIGNMIKVLAYEACVTGTNLTKQRKKVELTKKDVEVLELACVVYSKKLVGE